MRLRVRFLVFLFVFGFFISKAQVAVVGSNAADGNYPSLGLAFTAINTASQRGNDIVITLTASTAETSTATLYSGEWNTIKIFPVVSGLTVSGKIDAPLIDLNGADHVTIDGRVQQSGAADLLITNTSTSNASGTSTIRFINSAENNTVKYCVIQGAETNTSSGIVSFSSATTGNGNDGNLILYNNITGSVAGRAINAVYSAGTRVSENSGNSICNNNIYDFLHPAIASNGIRIAANNTQWIISGNSLYETTSFAPVDSVRYKGISISSTTSSGIVVEGNFIGGSLPFCSGVAWTKTNQSNNPFMAIYLNVGIDKTTSVQGNVIRNINWQNSGTAEWRGINIAAGNVDAGTITPNMLGDAIGNGSLAVTSGATDATVYGISVESRGIVNIQHNTIGSIAVNTASDTDAANFYGIYITTASGITTVIDNIIGSTTTPNSIKVGSLSTEDNQFVYGIYSTDTGSTSITGNVIANLTNATTRNSGSGRVVGIASTNGTNILSNNTIHDLTIANNNTYATNSASAIGIALTGTTNKTVTGNTIYNLSNTNSAFSGCLFGIYFTGGNGDNVISGNTVYNISAIGTNVGAAKLAGINFNAGTGNNIVSTNFIHSLSVAGTTSATSVLYGIKIISGTTTYSNNIISLGGNTKTTIYGIYESGIGGTNNIYCNTVSIGGSLVSGCTNKSYAFYSSGITNKRDVRNNVFVNARSTVTGVNLHYAAYFDYAVNTNLTLDYNDYYTSGSGGVVGYYNGANKVSVPIVSGNDANSIKANPVFILPNATIASGYRPCVRLYGIYGTGITTDFALNPRAAIPAMGAWENDFNKWKGSAGSDWNNSFNWTGNVVPPLDADIIFDASPLNDCNMNGNRSVHSIVNASTKQLVINTDDKLTVKGSLSFTEGAKVDASATNSTIEFGGDEPQSIPNGVFLNNDVYNLIVNNPANVTLNGTLNLLNTITATSGRLDAFSNRPTVIYSGTMLQTIGDEYYEGKIDNLVINNSNGVTLQRDVIVNNSLVINPNKLLTIPPAKQLNVVGKITNNAGTSGLVIQSDSLSANGSLIFHNTVDNPVLATVEMYSKAFKNDAASVYKYKWQFFGIPIRTLQANPTFCGSYVRKQYETGTTSSKCWTQLHNENILTSFAGYEISQATPKTIVFCGQLENRDFNSGKLSCTSRALYPGQHLFSNPYTAAIDIAKLNFGTQMEASVYLYNTGSYQDWDDNTAIPVGNNQGQYTVVPINHAGQDGLPTQIPSMQGFLVKALNNSQNATFTIPYSSVVVKNTDRQRVPAIYDASSANKGLIQVDVKGIRFSDRMWIFLEPICTHSFDNGWDGHKMLGSALAPQLFAMEADGNYQVNSVNDINNTYLGFHSGEDANYTLSFTHKQLENSYEAIYLEDLVENKVVDITQSGTEYSFKTDSADTLVKRFKIVAKPVEKNELKENLQINIYSSQGTIFIENLSNLSGELSLFDLAGHYLKKVSFSANANASFSFGVNPGTYLAKATTGGGEITKRLILK